MGFNLGRVDCCGHFATKLSSQVSDHGFHTDTQFSPSWSPPDSPQEAVSQAEVLAGSLDETWQVSHGDLPQVAVVDNANLWRHGGNWNGTRAGGVSLSGTILP